MVETFSQQSGMKPEWAMKCLEDTNWDFEVTFGSCSSSHEFQAAGNAFNQLRANIPPEAFSNHV